MESGCGFGGYKDWTYEDFCAKVSIRSDHENDYQPFEIGTYGLCISCGCETSEGLYCEECNDSHPCDCCGYHYSEEELYTVHDCYGDTLEVCECCRDRYYSYCDDCGEYYPQGEMTCTVDGSYVCSNCLESDYVQCHCCGEWVRDDYVYMAIDSDDGEVTVCESCLNESYVHCDDCDEWVHEDDIETAYDEHGHEHHIGPCCAGNYKRCDDCYMLFKPELLEDGLCPECKAKAACKEEIA